MGFLSFLFIVFLVLRLVHVIDWSWWAVFGPLIAEAVLAVLALTGSLVLFRRVFK